MTRQSAEQVKTMEISVVNPFRNMPQAAGGAALPPKVGADVSKLAVTVTNHEPSALETAGEVGVVPDEALRRDDDLGSLFSKAFDLPAAPAPAFAKLEGA